MQIVTRAQALTLKQNKYYTGRPCRRGHDSPRYTGNATCVACAIAAASVTRKEIWRALRE